MRVGSKESIRLKSERLAPRLRSANDPKPLIRAIAIGIEFASERDLVVADVADPAAALHHPKGAALAVRVAVPVPAPLPNVA